MPERIYTAPYTCVSCGGPKTRTEDDLCPACIEKAKRSAEIKMDEATLRRAIAAYGKNAQVDMAIEEMSELTKALCKERRYELVKGTHAEAHANVIEEIADVLIMCRQMLIIFDRDEEIQAEINYKIQRLKQRLDKREEK